MNFLIEISGIWKLIETNIYLQVIWSYSEKEKVRAEKIVRQMYNIFRDISGPIRIC